jgi:hypothetical protein
MHRSEERRAFACSDCGAAVPAAARAFAFAGEGVLCWECATRRGGAYDEAEDRWSVSPRLDGLGDLEDDGRS